MREKWTQLVLGAIMLTDTQALAQGNATGGKTVFGK